MLRATPTLHKMASTHGGMRRILKKRLPVERYIELAVKAGSYKSPSTRPHYLGLHDVPEKTGYISPREREERIKLRRGVIDYPTEYEILSLNPPLPDPPRTPVRVRKKIIADKRRRIAQIKKERKKKGLTDDDPLPSELPSMDRLVKSYLRRHDDKLRAGMSPSQSRREEEYYSKLLLSENDSADDVISLAQKKVANQSSLQTAMGRKSMLVENAYAFALRQQQVMLQGDSDKAMSEQSSVDKVEQLLMKESRANRQEGHKTAGDVEEWRAGLDDSGEGEGTTTSGDYEDDNRTLPSILHERPRAIRALNIWSARLSSIPYSRWTIGASTALDHWIAREVLQMDEVTWQQVLEGGGTDAYVVGIDTLPGGESRRGLMDRMRDIVVVRGALFPETVVEKDGRDSVAEITGELDDVLLEDEEGSANATEKSIDELLATLGETNDDDDDIWNLMGDKDEKEEEENVDNAVNDEKMATIMDELEVWRGRNESSPYEAWDADRKTEFDQWIEKYVVTLYPEADASTVDKEATRTSLLSQQPMDAGKTKEFWSSIGTETGAENFLQDYRSTAQEKLNSMEESFALTKEGSKMQTELEAILSVSFESQLDKIVNMGTLRPILDAYAPGKDRESFLERYAPFFLEGLEMEHLVPDQEGAIRLEDLSADLREEMSRDWKPSSGVGMDGQEPRFSIEMVAYGTDEFGTARAERARELFKLWNEHKANRARFEEAMFKRGYLRLEEDGVRGQRRKKKDDKKKD